MEAPSGSAIEAAEVAAALRRALESYAPTERGTPSEVERRFIRLCRRFGGPLPSINVPLPLPDGGVAIVDAVWRRERLVVELDGPRTHGTRAAFERDRRRDAQLMLSGYGVVRFTWRQVTEAPTAIGATVQRLLRGGTRTRLPGQV